MFGSRGIDERQMADAQPHSRHFRHEPNGTFFGSSLAKRQRRGK
jgi:hypothetical protein